METKRIPFEAISSENWISMAYILYAKALHFQLKLFSQLRFVFLIFIHEINEACYSLFACDTFEFDWNFWFSKMKNIVFHFLFGILPHFGTINEREHRNLFANILSEKM